MPRVERPPARVHLGREGPADVVHGFSAADQVADAALAHHGEGLIGLENLYSNLSDFEVALTTDERVVLQRFADGRKRAGLLHHTSGIE